MSVSAIIKGVRPKGTAKWLEAELDCSPRQAWRIVQTGKVPGRFRSAVLRLLDAAIARNKAELEKLQDELRAIKYAEMVGRAAERRTFEEKDQAASAAGPHAAMAARSDRRP